MTGLAREPGLTRIAGQIERIVDRLAHDRMSRPQGSEHHD